MQMPHKLILFAVLVAVLLPITGFCETPTPTPNTNTKVTPAPGGVSKPAPAAAPAPTIADLEKQIADRDNKIVWQERAMAALQTKINGLAQFCTASDQISGLERSRPPEPSPFTPSATSAAAQAQPTTVPAKQSP